MTRLGCNGLYFNFTDDLDSERIVKIG